MATNRSDSVAVLDNGDEPTVRAPSSGAIGRSVKVSERIAAALVADIVSDGLEPGARLPNEAAMLERFQVGRASLREALRILEVYGLISLQPGPGGGPIVCAIDPRSVSRTFSLYLSLAGATITEVQESRLHIEPMIARTAAEEQDPVALARLRQALDDEEALPLGDPAYTVAANNFHLTLGMLSGNKVLNLLATALQDLYATPLVAGAAGQSQPEPTAEMSIRNEHRAIAGAILSGDADLAERLTREHVVNSVELVKRILPTLAASTVTWS